MSVRESHHSPDPEHPTTRSYSRLDVICEPSASPSSSSGRLTRPLRSRRPNVIASRCFCGASLMADSVHRASPLRRTWQVGPDHWITVCTVCPRRFSRTHAKTERQADGWWADHISSATHTSYATSTEPFTDEETRLAEIFGKSLPERVPASRRSGHIVSRPDVGAKLRNDDNPLGPGAR
jgi:hypothetical protein